MNHTTRENAAFTRAASGFRFNAYARWHIHSRTIDSKSSSFDGLMTKPKNGSVSQNWNAWDQ